MNIPRYFYTLRDLKFRQIYYQVWYRLRRRLWDPSIKGKRMCRAPLVSRRAPITRFIAPTKSLFRDDTFVFLNIPGKFQGWNDLSHGRLWAYNLNYMDYLLQEQLDEKEALKWIERFIAEAPVNFCGYEPYPIALRSINWIKFLLTERGGIDEMLRSRIHDSLFAQYRILNESLEYHLLGNHLLEDGFSLVIGGLYFSNKKWFRKGRKIVIDELNEQVLEDGGHFELSPMYHRILLGRLLDCIHIVQIYSVSMPGTGDLLHFLRAKASQMRGWMDHVRFADGTFPLLNDSAEGISYTDLQLDDYADRLGIPASTSFLSSSGYRKIVHPRYECFVDIGRIGPSYIPGHAHADTFNFVLRVDGCDTICDTGISTYEKNQRRHYERSTQAHNTIVVAGENSSDVWGGFRAGRKAEVKIEKDTPEEIIAQHNGYRPMDIVHRREWHFAPAGIEVTDRIFDPHAREHIAILNLSPDFILEGNVLYNVRTRIEVQGAKRIEIVPEHISRKYNEFIEIKKVRIRFSETLKTHIEIL